MSKPKMKKTVSFSDSTGPSSTVTSKRTEIPLEKHKLHRTLKVLPLHIPILFAYIFQQDLENQWEETLIKSSYILLALQIPYSALVLSQVKKAKFTIRGDYQFLLFGILGVLILSFIINIIVVLFGAPLNLLKENYLLSVDLALLLYPAVVILGKLGINRVSYWMAIGVAIGGWLGAIVIPLDWDRPWQRWPLPIVGGGYLGAAMGVIALLV